MDETFRLDPAGGPPFLVKLAELGGADEAVSFQAGLLRHLELAAPDLPVPRVRATAAARTTCGCKARSRAGSSG